MGLYVAFEGIEGCGKTTLANLFCNWLKQKGERVVLTREPGGTDLGRRLRELLLFSDPSPMAELFIFLADRAEHIKKLVKPSLDAGLWVVSDRCFLSTLAYQGYGRGILDLDRLRDLCRLSAGGLVPDLIFLIDVDPEVSLARIEEADRIESEPIEFHKRVRRGYLKEAKRLKAVVLDGRNSPSVLLNQVIDSVNQMLAASSGKTT